MTNLKEFLYRLRWSIFSVAVLACFAALVIAVLPIGVRYGIVAALEQGGGRKATVENVDFNPFTGNLVIEGFRVTAPSGRGISIARLATDVEVSALVKRRLHFRRIEIERGNIDIDLDQDGNPRLAGFPLGASPRAAGPRAHRSVDWLFGIDGLRLARLAVNVHYPDSSTSLRIDSFTLNNLEQWQVTIPARFETRLQLDKARLRITGTTQAFAASPSISTEVSLTGLSLARLRPFLRGQGMADISGRVSADLRSRVVFEANQRTAIYLKGGLRVARLSALITPEGTSPSSPRKIGLADANIDQLDARLDVVPGGPSKLALDGTARISGLTLNGADYAVRQGSASWNGALRLSASGAGPSELTLRGDLGLSESRVTTATAGAAEGEDLSAEAITLRKLSATLGQSASGQNKAQMTGEVAITGAAAKAGGETIGAERISWKGSFVARDDRKKGAMTAEVKGKLAITGATAKADGNTVRAREVSWDGDLSALRTETAGPDIRGSGKLLGRGLGASLSVPPLALSQDQTVWQGEFTYRAAPTEESDALAMKAKLQAMGTRIEAPKAGTVLLQLADLAIAGIDFSGLEGLRIDRITGRDVRSLVPRRKAKTNAATTPKAPVEGDVSARGVLTLDRVSVDGLAITPDSHVAAKAVAMDQAKVLLELDKDGQWRPFQALQGLFAEEPSAAAQADGPVPTFSIGNLDIDGKSSFTFTDLSVTPNAAIKIAPLKIRMKEIDSRKPGAKSPITVDAQVGRYGKIDLNGTISPFRSRISLNAKGEIKGLELSDIRGYARKYLGYDLTRGRLDAELAGGLANGELSAETTLRISKLQVSTSDPGRAKPMTDRLQIPLQSALALLRDSDDVIRLKVPITGDLSNPQFNFGDAINTALANAMKATVLTTVKIAFPLGGVILTLAEAAGGSRLSFAPVPYNAGGAALTPPARDQVAKIASLLRARPTLKITVCGTVTERDRKILLDRARAKALGTQPDAKSAAKPAPGKDLARGVAVQLGQLSRKRSETIKDALIRDHQIDGERVFLCATKLQAEKAKGAIPRADIFI